MEIKIYTKLVQLFVQWNKSHNYQQANWQNAINIPIYNLPHIFQFSPEKKRECIMYCSLFSLYMILFYLPRFVCTFPLYVVVVFFVDILEQHPSKNLHMKQLVNYTIRPQTHPKEQTTIFFIPLLFGKHTCIQYIISRYWVLFFFFVFFFCCIRCIFLFLCSARFRRWWWNWWMVLVWFRGCVLF